MKLVDQCCLYLEQGCNLATTLSSGIMVVYEGKGIHKQAISVFARIALADKQHSHSIVCIC